MTRQNTIEDMKKAVEEMADMVVHVCRHATGYSGDGIETASPLVQEAITRATLRQGQSS